VTALRFHSGFQADLKAAGEYYLEEGGKAVLERFLVAVDRALEDLVNAPDWGTPIPNHPFLRSFGVKRFKHRLIYAREEAQIMFFALAHPSRKPEFWVDRLDPDEGE